MTLTVEYIKNLLKTNDQAVCRALVALHNRQTSSEKYKEASIVQNDRGFRPCHAKKGSSMATYYQHFGYLSPKQINYWRVQGKEGMRIEIYARQLLEIAQQKKAA